MPPVQIPELQTMDPAPQPGAGRIDVNVPSPVGATEQDEQSLNEAGGAVAHVVDQVTKNTYVTNALNKTNGFDMWAKGQVYGNPGQLDDDGNPVPGTATVGLKDQQGDPTKAYAKFYQDAQDHMDNLINDPNMSNQERAITAKLLNNRYRMIYDKALVTYGQQYNTYNNGLTDSSVKLAQTNTVGTTVHIDPNNFDDTVVPFRNSLNDIKFPIVHQGLLNNGVKIAGPGDQANSSYVDEDGQVQKLVASPQYLQKMNEAMSTGISNSIKNLIDTGTPQSLDAAQKMKDEFSQGLDPVSRDQVDEQYKKADVTLSAQQAYGKVAHLPPMQQMSQLDQMFSKPEDVPKLIAAKALVNTGVEQNERLQKAQSSDNYNKASQLLTQMQTSGNAPVDFNDALNNPTNSDSKKFKQLFNNVTDAGEIKALKSMIDKPDESNPQNLNTYYDHIKNGDLADQDINKVTSGLNVHDTNMAKEMYQRMSNPNDRQSIAQINTQLQQTAIAKGLVKPNKFSGRVTDPDDVQTLNTLSTSINATGGIPSTATAKEKQDYLDKAVTNAYFTRYGSVAPAPIVPAVEPFKPTKQVSGATKKPLASLSTSEMDQVGKGFQTKYGRVPSNTKELLDFYNKE